MKKTESCNHCSGGILDGDVIHFMIKINDRYESVFYHVDCALVLHSIFCDHFTRDGHLKCSVAEKISLIEITKKEKTNNGREQSNPKSDD
jgi:hypothetical protein